jgi:pimeloyl-ACP methyl ester carboxylesterase
MIRPSRLALAAMAGLLSLPAGPVLAARTLGHLTFEPCTLAAPGMPITVPAQCASLEVPENRAQPQGRRIHLSIAWVPTDAKQPQPDPALMIAGGPGQSALESFPTVALAFDEILRHRSVILVDQRGTGGSNLLSCPEGDKSRQAAELDAATARKAAAECLATLPGDPRYYTTSDAIDDLDDVRRAIGATTWNLIGVSYGTRVALEYLRRHPAATRTVVLDGVVPPELILGADHARNLEQAVDAQFARCAADAACAKRYGPAPRKMLDDLRASLQRQPQVVHFRDPLTHQPREDTLTADTVAGVVRLYAYAPQTFALLPLALAEASAGRPEALMAQAAMLDALVGEHIAQGMSLAVTCSEDAFLLKTNPADRDTLMGDAFVTTILAQCADWPRGRMPADFHQPVLSDRPVLLMSGEFDPVTPPRNGELVLKGLSHGRHFVLTGQGHNVMGAGCMPRLMADFIADADASSLDSKCLGQLIRTPVFTGSYGWEP